MATIDKAFAQVGFSEEYEEREEGRMLKKRKLIQKGLAAVMGIAVAALLRGSAVQAAGVLIDENNFSDPTFRSYVSEHFNLEVDGQKDGILSEEERNAVTKIDCSGNYSQNGNIASLKGVEWFPNLTELNCDYNQLTSLDVSKNAELTVLTCSNNQLSDLNVSQNASLQTLNCMSNQLESLDISHNTMLTDLTCVSNLLTNLDVSANTLLKGLNCDRNQFSTLDVSKNAQLEVLNCGYNQLKSLDLRNNPALLRLGCFSNKLSNLDISNNPNLYVLDCFSNQFKTLDLSKNKILKKIVLMGNRTVASVDGRDAYMYRGEDNVQRVFVGASVKIVGLEEEEQDPVLMDSALAAFEGKIGVVFRMDLPDYVRNDPKAYAIFTKNGKESKMLVSEAIPEVVEGKTLYRFTKYVVAKEYRENINIKLFDGEGNPITVKGKSGTDYTATGVDYSLEKYVGKKKTGSDAKMAALAIALEDYCTAAQIYFEYNAAGLTVSDRVKAVTADQLVGYKGVFEGNMPAGMKGRSISASFESDNAFKLFYTYNGGVDPKSFAYAIDGNPATLHEEDGTYFLMKSNVAAKNLDKVYAYTITKGDDTYTVKCSVLTYARSSVNNGTDARKDLGRSLYLYNQAAKAYFGE